MDFFRSTFAMDPQPSVQESPPETKSEPSDQSPIRNSHPGSNAGGWSFGGLIKTLAASSESVISTYRRDLEEFRSGLQKETAVIRDAIKEIPVSLEAGASAAQDSIESVGRAIDGFGASVWHGTADIISQGNDAFLSSDQESDGLSDAQNASNCSNPKSYSRFEAEVVAIQSDLRTFREDPDDLDDFRKWRSGLVLDKREQEIEDLSGENGVLEGVYTKLVPETVDRESFWSRYFYKVFKLKQAEEARVDLVKRVISGEDNEELSWDVEDEENETEENVALEAKSAGPKNSELEKKDFFAGSEPVTEKKSSSGNAIELVSEQVESVKFNVKMEGDADQSMVNRVEKVEKSEEKIKWKEDHGESGMGGSFSAAPTHLSAHDDEELGWDEIEDIGDNDEKKMVSGENPSGFDLHKRVSAVEVEEDLSWDIDDDDEPVKQ